MERTAYDVVVVGGGNAALCAALTARTSGARVLVVESAPRAFRGGNSRHTRNMRVWHSEPSGYLTGRYSEDEFFADLLEVTGDTNESLARMVIHGSAECPVWMQRHGARFQQALRGTLHLDRTNAFFLGGGKALMNSYYAAAERLGIEVTYDSEVVGFDFDETRVSAVHIGSSGSLRSIGTKAVVLASGGFESNLEWLHEVWGSAADNFIIRGTPYNTGRVLKLMLDAGAQAIGDPRSCHAVAVDARAPKFDGGIVTRLDCIPLGIVVNKCGVRFYDEGEDFWPKRYAIWGSLVAQQPDQIAFAIVDAKVVGRFMPSVFPPLVANTWRELAAAIGVPAQPLEDTLDTFNRAVRPGRFDHTVLDDCATVHVRPSKSHWAQPLDTPPFWAYPLRPGITFTYLGLMVDHQARVTFRGGIPAKNIFAAGEIMAGNILRQGYIAGVGMTIGTVMGRLAGAEASREAR